MKAIHFVLLLVFAYSIPNPVYVIKDCLEKLYNVNDNIELKNYVTKDNQDTNEYNLISFIKNPPIEKEKKDGIIFCKSPVNNEWYKYEGLKCEKTNIKDIIKNEKSIPYLLIYQNKSI